MAEYAQGASAVASIFASLMGGQAASTSRNFQAAQLDQRAGQEIAASQRAAAETRRQGALKLSALRARAGGAGGDPSLVGLSGDIAAETEYRALTDLFEGKERATGLHLQADASRAEGRAAVRAGWLGVARTMFDKGPGLLERFGGGGPYESKFRGDRGGNG